jgi:hypothetical protein
MTRTEKSLAEKNLDLIFEFERYLQEHPAFAKQIPQNAFIALQVKGDNAFNRWSRRLAEKQRGGDQYPVVHISINKLGPVRSRIEALDIEHAA